MDTNKMRELKALAEAATQSHGARRVEVDHDGVHVIGDGSWKILSAWRTPDGKGAHNAEFAAAASPVTVLALLAEIESTETRLHDVAVLCATVEQERDQLKAENEALRKALGDLLSLYEDDEGCRNLPEYIAGRAAMAKEANHG
ncbi:ead/Ea22-like family protein [Pseudomonas putida]|uniref:ead/Ea22-like family protein n=1 Tax=Pseudomonas putida TaxID=303 RepID=UPI002B243888|nr:ead/Ea22-like family protein [Pseudomonas putida]